MPDALPDTTLHTPLHGVGLAPPMAPITVEAEEQLSYNTIHNLHNETCIAVKSETKFILCQCKSTYIIY
jgi:hypothetical protein